MATSEVNVYPSPTVGTQTPTGSNESNGSFGPVLIVLGVILVLVIISVVVGRICNKKKGGHKVKSQGKDKKSKDKSKDKHQTHSHHHGQVQPGGDPADIEFGFDKRFASAKVASGDQGFDFKVPPKVQAYNGGGSGGGGGRGGGGNGGGGGDPGFDFRGQKVQAYNGGAGGGGGGGGDHGFDFRGPKVQAYNGGAGGGHGPRGPHAVRFADEHRVDFRTGA